MSEEIKNSNVEETVKVNEEVVEQIPQNQTWLNRIVSVIIGAIIAAGVSVGITYNEVNEAKTKTTEVKTYAAAALEAIKAGDVTTATEKLQLALATTKEVAQQVKKTAEKVKEADKKSVVENVKKAVTESLVKDQAKKVETTSSQYTEQQTTKTTKVTNTIQTVKPEPTVTPTKK